MKIGKVPENVLKRSVLRQIKTKREEVLSGAGVGEDCAIFSLSDHVSSMMTCIQEAAVAVSGAEGAGEKNRGRLTVTMGRLIDRCANNLAAGGAEIMSVMIALYLPEETEEATVKALMAEAEEKCKNLKIQIAGGQTRISNAVRMPVAVVAGYGVPFGQQAESQTGENAAEAYRGKRDCRRKPKPGQDVVISKWIGLEGTAILAEKSREKLLARYPAYLVDEAACFDRFLSVIPEAATAVKSGVCTMHDASEGGIFGTLWELAERAGVGLTIDLKKLPLRQETVEVCECCNVNPYELLSGGCLVMTSGDGPGLVAALEAEGIPAVIVGKVTDSNDRIMINEDEVRYMDRPGQDEIYRFLSE